MSITLSLSIHKRIIFAGFYLPNKQRSVLKNVQITTEEEVTAETSHYITDISSFSKCRHNNGPRPPLSSVTDTQTQKDNNDFQGSNV